MEIATPVFELARNDREFAKFQFAKLLVYHVLTAVSRNLSAPQGGALGGKAGPGFRKERVD